MRDPLQSDGHNNRNIAHLQSRCNSGDIFVKTLHSGVNCSGTHGYSYTMPQLDFPHRRYNPLTGDYVLVSPHRTKRPWQGQQEKPPAEAKPKYDPKCYLCPGNARAGDAQNPDYDGTFVFTNDFAALLPETPEIGAPAHPLLRAEPVQGTSRVLCFSPRHDLTLPEMPLETIRAVVEMWDEQTTDLGKTYQWVQVFQNKGSAMGASNPHPHGQVCPSPNIQPTL